MSRFKAQPPMQLLTEDFNHHENVSIVHPFTGMEFWEFVEAISQLPQQTDGKFYLRTGKHIGPHNDFGVRHVWRERGRALIKRSYPAAYYVPCFVADIIAYDSAALIL